MIARLGARPGALVRRPDLAVEQRLGDQPTEPLDVDRGRPGAADVAGDRGGRGRRGLRHWRRLPRATRSGPSRRHVEHGLLELRLRQRQREEAYRDSAVGVGREDVERPVVARRERQPEVVVDVGRHARNR